MELNIKNAKDVLKKYLGSNEKKYNHSIRVAQISKVLAKKWNVSIEEAVIAALLHDIGKKYSRREILEYCSINNIVMYDFEIFYNATALHGKISADIFKKEFSEEKNNVKFKKIHKAILNHVSGSEDMSDLDKLIFISDNIEPEKRDADLYEMIQVEDVKMDEIMKKIIERKKERAIENNRFYNPVYDETLEGIDR